MATDRLTSILTLMAQREREHPKDGSLCAVAAEVTNLSGAGIALVSSGEQYTSVCTSNDIAHTLMDLEITVGEGPCVDACISDVAIDESNLATTLDRRWLAYSPLAKEAGAHAVFAFPVRIGAIRLGALSLYRDEPGPLSAVMGGMPARLPTKPVKTPGWLIMVWKRNWKVISGLPSWLRSASASPAGAAPMG